MNLFVWLWNKIRRKSEKMKDEKFICPVGEVEAEIIPLTYEEKEYALPYPLHNFRGKYTVKCPKMCMDWEDDGGCFSCDIDVPGVCFAAPQNMAKHCPSVAQWYQHQWCGYLPNIQGRKHDYNRVVNLPFYIEKREREKK